MAVMLPPAKVACYSEVVPTILFQIRPRCFIFDLCNGLRGWRLKVELMHMRIISAGNFFRKSQAIPFTQLTICLSMSSLKAKKVQ